MTTAKFKIVEFKDNEMSIVPKLWLNDNTTECKWPNYTSQTRIDKAIHNLQPPEDEWSSHAVIRVHCSASKFDKFLCINELFFASIDGFFKSKTIVIKINI